MTKEEIEERFNLNELIKKQIDDCFNDNLMETLNAALIFKYVDTLQQQLKKQKEIIDKAKNKLNSFIDCCKAEKLESGSDYLHHQYWDMFERFNKQIKEILEDKGE